MLTSDHMRERIRPQLAALVKDQSSQGGTLLQAYTRTGALIGRSSQWVQRILGRSHEAHVYAHDWLNITALCEKLEAKAARNNAHADFLRGVRNATEPTVRRDLELGTEYSEFEACKARTFR